ncbi:MAG: nucleoside transporter C-terminal domain-containing protein [Desulfobacteraceae bacterium]|jgi:CNT family concentrative nucleoside transporter
MTMFQGLCGLIAFIAAAWLMSENRRKIPLKLVAAGVVLQLLLGLLLLKLPVFQQLFLGLNAVVLALEESTKAGTSMVFGYLGGGPLPFEAKAPGNVFILGFRALPLVLVMSALSSVLFYWGILPRVVKGFAWCLTKTMRIGGTEGLGVAANVFVGMVEAPLLIRPYLAQMTRSELFTLMTAGMSTIAGTVMVLYASILGDVIPGVTGHILTASIISMPAAIIISKVMIPETAPLTTGELKAPEKVLNTMDAVTQGTLQGVQLLINILAMLVVLVALVHLINIALGLLPAWGQAPITLQRIFGYLMFPVVWLMGVPWSEALTAGALMGTKTILNEFIAYLDLGRLAPGALSMQSKIILTYGLCGFANPGSLGIMIGGLGTMAPQRRGEIVSLGLRSIVAGTLATSMTGAVVGILSF